MVPVQCGERCFLAMGGTWAWLLNYVLVSFKNAKTGQVQWLTSVILAFWEAEVGALLEPRSLRPVWTT